MFTCLEQTPPVANLPSDSQVLKYRSYVCNPLDWTLQWTTDDLCQLYNWMNADQNWYLYPAMYDYE